MKKLLIALAASMALMGGAQAHDKWRGDHGKGWNHYKHFGPYYRPYGHYAPHRFYPYGYQPHGYNPYRYNPYSHGYYYNPYYRPYYYPWR